MWFGGGCGGTRLVHLSVVGLLLTSLLLVWACSHSCRPVMAIRPPPPSADEKPKLRRHGIFDSKAKRDLLHKYFPGRKAFATSTSVHNNNNGTSQNQKSFRDSKRRVPSCPDPLHN